MCIKIIIIEPTKTTTNITTTIFASSTQSLEGSSEKATPRTIEAIAPTIKILTIKFFEASK